MPAKLIDKNSLVHVVQYMRVKYKDIFDMKAFYEALYEWFKEYEWGDADDSLDEKGNRLNPNVAPSEHWETYYGERVDAKGLREMWIQWRLFKDPKDAPFLRYYLDVDFHCLGLQFGVEVIKEGVKLSVNRGEVELTINSYIEKRYEAEFEKSLLRHFTELFTKRIYRKELKAREKELYQETYALQNFIKQWFKMKRYLPYEEVKNFMPSYAWPSHVKE